jgi:hypothetical protein
MLDARIAAAALAVALAALPAPCRAPANSIGAPAPVPVGPPLICFPLDIGGAVSLPFATEGIDAKTKMAPDEIATTLRSILAASDDAVVHMETLRRASVWLMSLESEGRGASDPQHQNAVKLQSLLTDELLLAAAAGDDAKGGGTRGDANGEPKGDAPISTRQVALRWFDLGYFLAAAGQARVIDSGRSREWLERAVRMVPDDAALRFGTALAEFDFRSDGSGTKWARHLVLLFDEPKGAASSSAAAQANLRKNVLATFGVFLKQQEWDKLGAEVRKQSGRS